MFFERKNLLMFFLVGTLDYVVAQQDTFKQEFPIKNSTQNEPEDLHDAPENFDSKEAYKALNENNYQMLLHIARKQQNLKKLLLESIDQGVAENSHKVLFMKRLIKQSKKSCKQDLGKCQEEKRKTALLLGAIVGGVGAVVACSCGVGILLLTGILKRH